MSSELQTQSAYCFEPGVKEPVLKEIPIPEPKENQVLLKVRAAGLCLSDVHIVESTLLGYNYTFTMGHEIAGEIYKCGSLVDSTTYPVGGKFAVYSAKCCLNCEFCQDGKQNLCKNNSAIWYGVGANGGFEKYVLVENLAHLNAIPEGVSFEQAAVASDAILTPYHAISTSDLNPSKRVLLIGLGGLGSCALQIVKGYNSYVVCVDRKEDLKSVADEFGADEFYTDLTKSDVPKMSFDAVFDFVAIQSTFEISQQYVKNGGIIKPVGLGQEKITFNLSDLGTRDVKIIGSCFGTPKEQQESMNLVQRGIVKPKITTYKFEEFPKAYELLKSGKSTGRLVLSM
ncbi:hypothetical protein CANARDRAFT_97898 [[Candida] arabinofermentans NRRL YB-2248]|uniref:Enoyl reductase (ER) domain-containing protein n=1 Tax=[Candida] arabinofermentans NRRL YB-2248 TaxID=983967 RepID=A0A1E4T752_9ASCO|nr:hypothetical protein CANARDRAFT_97898 [[Candida] arabinofermentans NRRL YB-2248]